MCPFDIESWLCPHAPYLVLLQWLPVLMIADVKLISKVRHEFKHTSFIAVEFLDKYDYEVCSLMTLSVNLFSNAGLIKDMPHSKS